MTDARRRPPHAAPASPDAPAGPGRASRPIVGDHPTSGVRIALERPAASGDAPPWRYEGFVFTPTTRHALSASIDEGGTVAVTLGDTTADADAPPGLADKVRLLLRTAYKQSRAEGGDAPEPPPRRLVRWRGEK